MPRKTRVHYSGALYHVISRGNNRQEVFIQEGDYRLFLDRLKRLIGKTPFVLYAYCLMPNHFHLLLEVAEFPLSDIMQRLLTGYTLLFNRRHQRVGHLFQGRYKAILCDKESYLLELIRYIHVNPVRAGLVASTEKWPWSSHLDYLRPARGLAAVDRVLPIFSDDGKSAREAYSRFIQDRTGLDGRTVLHAEEIGPLTCVPDWSGTQKTDSVKRPSPDRSETPLSELLRQVADARKLTVEGLSGRSRTAGLCEARKIFIRRAYGQGHRPGDIAKIIQRTPAFVTLTVAGSEVT